MSAPATKPSAGTTRGSRFKRRSAVSPAQAALAAPAPLSVLLDSTPLPAVARRDRAFRNALLVSDVVASIIVVGVNAVWLNRAGPSWTALLLPVLTPLVNAANRLYDRDERVLNKSTLEEAPGIFHAATLIAVVAYLLESALLHLPIGAHAVGGAWLGLALLLPACRSVARAVTRRLLPPERCLVIGDTEQGRRLATKIEDDAGTKAELVGVLRLGAEADRSATVKRLARAVDAKDVHRVVIAGDADGAESELETIQAAKALGVKVSVVPRVLEVVGSSASYDYVDGLTVLGVPRFGLSTRAKLLKRTFDLAGSGLLLVVLAPALALIALAVKLGSPGPVLFRQTRIGRDGRPFSMLKFRSMHRDADALKDSLRARNEAEGLFKIADDPRVTRIGRLLRRTSLDELPQLVNVLRGEMSLVGPRPLVPDEDRQIQGWHRRRLHLTPGMTGPWQVLGSARIPLAEMVTIDYLYVANWSLWADVKVLLRTAGAMLARRGR
jgi:exopolysaccharide biosynthesis polyprenyl glycosylphosphotransferase